MSAMHPAPLRTLGLTLLIGGFLAGSLSGCAARRRPPASGTATAATAAPSQPTAVSSAADQGAQIDQLLGAMQDQLSKTDTVPEGANP